MAGTDIAAKERNSNPNKTTVGRWTLQWLLYWLSYKRS